MRDRAETKSAERSSRAVTIQGLSVIGAAQKIESRERNHTMIVGEGSYLLRYISAGVASHPPNVRVRPSPKDGKGILLVPVTDDLGRGLRHPGDYLLVHAKRTGAIDLTVSANRPNGSLEAEVRLERIAAVEEPTKPTQQRVTRVAERDRDEEPVVQILAHVSHRGDVISDQGEWMCGPDFPMPIEGLEIRWPNKPAGVNLSYEVAAGQRKRERSRRNSGWPVCRYARRSAAAGRDQAAADGS